MKDILTKVCAVKADWEQVAWQVFSRNVYIRLKMHAGRSALLDLAPSFVKQW